MVTSSRIRWSQAEKAFLTDQCAQIIADHPDYSMRRVIEEALRTLPEARRRPLHPSLQRWFAIELDRRASTRRGRGQAADARKPKPGLPPTRQFEQPSTSAAQRGSISDNDSDGAGSFAHPLLALGVAAGVNVLVGILSDIRVRSALQDLLRETLGERPSSRQ